MPAYDAQEFDIRQILEPLIKEQLKAENEFLEMWCEKMLTDPEGRGLLVKSYQRPGSYIRDYTCELSHDVPWGSMHTYQQTEPLNNGDQIG